MTTIVIVACLVAAGCVIAVPTPARRPARQLARLIRHSTAPGQDGSARHRVDPVRLGSGLAGLAAAIVVGGWFGVLAGAVVAFAADQGLRRLEPAAHRRRRLAEAAQLPLAADLLAVALRAGAPAERAAAAVAEALPGPLGDRLARVGRALSLGAIPSRAWAELAPVTGGARLARAAVRSAEHGSALADSLSRLAGDLRADRTIAVEAAGRRAGVLIVLPLGLCFLPAFVLAGLVPVVLAVLGDVL